MKKSSNLAIRLIRAVGFWQILFLILVIILGISMALGWIEVKPPRVYN